jgi:hypothetical protein
MPDALDMTLERTPHSLERVYRELKTTIGNGLCEPEQTRDLSLDYMLMLARWTGSGGATGESGVDLGFHYWLRPLAACARRAGHR